MDKTTKNLKTGLRIFLFLSILSTTVIIIFTASKETLTALKQINLLFLGLTFVSCGLRLYVECLRLQILTSTIGNRITLKHSAEFTFGGYFLSILPFGVGGLPLQFYILNKEKFSIGESGTIIAMRGITYLIAFVFAIPFIIYYKDIFKGSGLQLLSSYIVIIYSVLIILFFLTMWKTDQVKFTLNKLSKFFTVRDKTRVAHWVTKFADELGNFRTGFKKCCVHGYLKFIIVIFLSALSLFFYVLMVPLLFNGLGIKAPIIKTALIQFILTFLLMFTPTPGGSGIAEGAGFALFNSICPKPLMAVFIILWRFFTYYTGVIIGGIFILRMLAGSKNKIPENLPS